MQRRWILLAALASLGARPCAGGDPIPTAADVTVTVRSIDRALDRVLEPDPASPGDRTVLLVVDASAALRAMAFADRWMAACDRNPAWLARTSLGLVLAGEKGRLAVAPTHEPRAIGEALRVALAPARNALRDVYPDVRAAAAHLAPLAGAHEVALVTLENGDAEDDVEGTASALRRAGVRLSVIAHEAPLSDSYWLHRGGRAPEGAELPGGGDGAFCDLPYSWLFQPSDGHEEVSSGFAFWGLSRLAAASLGRVYVVSEGTPPRHACTTVGSCLFCTDGDHTPFEAAYQVHRVRALAPLVGSREAVLAAAAADPWFRALLSAWGELSREGLVGSRPSVERKGGSLSLDSRGVGRLSPVSTLGPTLPVVLERAQKARRACEAVLAALDQATARLGPDEGSPRWRACVEHTKVMVRLTRANLAELMGWCAETAPELYGRKRVEAVPPQAPIPEADLQGGGWSWSSFVLCHGVRPFLRVGLPGGEDTLGCLRDLAEAHDAFLAHHAGTPLALALRRQGVAFFVPVPVAEGAAPDRAKSKGTTHTPTTPADKNPPTGATTTPDRPSRGSAGSTDGGATTGDGK